jgi:hypothetical protein
MEPEFSFDDLLRVGAENSRLKAEVERLKEWQALHSIAYGCNSRTADALGAEVDRLKAAIKNHRAQKADDRCIEDDDRLYAALGDGIKCDRQVGSKEDMLKNCARFIDRRCEAGKWPTYAELEMDRDAARAAYTTLCTELKTLRVVEMIEHIARCGRPAEGGEQFPNRWFFEDRGPRLRALLSDPPKEGA